LIIDDAPRASKMFRLEGKTTIDWADRDLGK